MKNKSTKTNQEGQYREPEEGDFSVNTTGEYDQLNSEEVIQKKEFGNIVGDTTQLNQPMPEANHMGETINLDGIGNGMPGGPTPQPGPDAGGGGGGHDWGSADTGYQQPDEPFNPGFGEMPEEEQDASSTLVADTLIEAYAGLKVTLGKLLEVSPKKMDKLHNAGTINQYMMIPRDGAPGSQLVSVKQIVHEFNVDIRPGFQTSDQFKDSVRPLLAGILKKKGLAPTPEQQLMLLVAIDLGSCAMVVAKGMGDRKEMLKHLANISENSKPQQRPGPVTPDVVMPHVTVVAPNEQSYTAPPAAGDGSAKAQDIATKVRKRNPPKTSTVNEKV